MKKWIVTGIVIASALNLWAQAPEMFRYQGRLVDGTNLVNATLPMSFKLYDAQSSGNLVYEDFSSVLVVDGLYSTTIGDDTVYGSLTNAMTNAAVYLELTVNEATLSPRERLVSVPYALNGISSTNDISQALLDSRYALLNGSNITSLDAFRNSIGALGAGDAIATVTNSVEQTVSTNTASVPSSAAVKTELDAVGGANAVISITHPDSRITYHTTIQSAALAMTDGCTLTGLRGFSSVTGVVFTANNAVYNFNNIPMTFNTTTNSAFTNSAYGRYETAFRIVATNSIINNLLINQYIHSLYPSGSQVYTLDWGSSADLTFNDCVVQTTDTHTNSALGTSKALVDSGLRTRFNRGAGIMYCSVTNLPSYNPIYVNHHGFATNTIFVGTKFIQNRFSAQSGMRSFALMGGSSPHETIASNMFVDCSYNGNFLCDAGSSRKFYNVNALSLDEVRSTVFPLTKNLFTEEDCSTATQGKASSVSTIDKLVTRILLPSAVVSSNEAVYIREPRIIDTNKAGSLNAYSTLIEYYTHGYPNQAGGGYTIPAYAKTMVNDNYYTASRTISLLVAPDIDLPATIKEMYQGGGASDYSVHTHIYYSSGGTVLSKTDKYGTAYAPSNNNGKYTVTLSDVTTTGAVDGDLIKTGAYTFYVDGTHSASATTFNIYRVTAASSVDPTNGTPATLVSGGITNNLTFVQDNITGTWNHAFFNSSRGIHLMMRGDNTAENSMIEVLGAQK